MYDIIVLENLCFLPSTRKREFGVFKSPLWGPLSGDLFFLVPEKAVFVWTEGLKYPDTFGRGLKFLQPNATALRVWCKWIHPLWEKHQLCTSITLICILFRLPLHDVKLRNATFSGGPRKRGDEKLLLDPDAVLRIQIQEISSTFFNLKNVT